MGNKAAEILKVYPINPPVASLVSIQLMVCIYGYIILMTAFLLAFSEIWVSHPLTLLNQLKDVELTRYWSAGFTSPHHSQSCWSPEPRGDHPSVKHRSADMYTPITHTSFCLSVCLLLSLSCFICDGLPPPPLHHSSDRCRCSSCQADALSLLDAWTLSTVKSARHFTSPLHLNLEPSETRQSEWEDWFVDVSARWCWAGVQFV